MTPDPIGLYLKRRCRGGTVGEDQADGGEPRLANTWRSNSALGKFRMMRLRDAFADRGMTEKAGKTEGITGQEEHREERKDATRPEAGKQIETKPKKQGDNIQEKGRKKRKK